LVFNCHHSQSVNDFSFPAPAAGKYKIVLNSDDKEFGGHGRIDNAVEHFTDEDGKLSIYITNRTAIALKKVD